VADAPHDDKSEAALTVTRLLRRWSSGDAAAFDALIPLVYEELRRLARRHLRNERPGHTLRPTDLVSEAYARLVGTGEASNANDRLHFFALAARTMRQVLVDHARRKSAGKRGGGERAVTLPEDVLPDGKPEGLVALDDALEALLKLDPRRARAIELHYFSGLTQPEMARLLNVHVNTVARDLRFAEAWLHRTLTEAQGP
jgi:RNA polymerase sigma factor (TIGR02999 family)